MGDTGAMLCKLMHDDMHPFIAAIIFIGVSQFILHLPSMTIGARDSIGSLLLDCIIYDFKPAIFTF